MKKRLNGAFRAFYLIAVLVLLGSAAWTGTIISANDLLSSSYYPTASFGMEVKSVDDAALAQVVTTGAEFLINKAYSTIECRQRIPSRRTVAILKFEGGSLASLTKTYQSSGAVIFTGGGTTVRINGDSLLMISPGRSGSIDAFLKFWPDVHFECLGNHNFYDPSGGISFFEHGNQPNSTMDVNLETNKVHVQWSGYGPGKVFWASVSPPKPFDWNASITNRVYMYGSSSVPYPSDSTINYCSQYGNILYMHCETMWINWQIDLTPRNVSEWNRVLNTAHNRGMKVMPYTTPLYFLKGTPKESLSNPDYTGGHAEAWGIPDNEDLFLQEISKVVTQYHADGLYFDGMYFAPQYLAASYHLTRYARNLVGSTGVLQYHATVDTPSSGVGRTHCPALNAYYNFVFRGEGEEDNPNADYLRYFLGTYNTSNSNGLYCNQGSSGLTPPQWLMEKFRKNNIRMFPGVWMSVSFLQTHYWPYLTPNLQNEIAPDLATRTSAFETQLEHQREIAERRAIEAGRPPLSASSFVWPGKTDIYSGAYWRFEEPYGATAYSSVTTAGPHGIAVGGVFQEPVVFGPTVTKLGLANTKSMEFDGIEGSYLNCGSGPYLDVGSSNFTLEAWICPRSAYTRPTIAGKQISGITSPPDTGYKLALIPTYTDPVAPRYKVQFVVRDADGGTEATVTSGDLAFNVWRHVAGVREGNQLRLYVDGALVGSVTLTGTANFMSNQQFGIGCNRHGDGGFHNPFDGYIDEVRLVVGVALPTYNFLREAP